MAYSPASMLSTNVGLAHTLNYYLTRKALDNLVTNTVFMKACEKFNLPKGNGKTLRMYRYNLLGTNTTANSSEGTVGTGLSTVSSRVVDCSIAQYDDFISWSDLHEFTDIANTAEEYTRLLSIRAAVSTDILVRTMFDNESSSTGVTLTGPAFQLKDLMLFRTKLQATDVKPMDDGNFLVIMHPNITYDLQNDPTAGGLMDISKYTSLDNARLKKMEDRGYITTAAGCKVIESTNTYSSGSTYRVYAFGNRCAGVVNLGDMGPTDGIEDPSSQRFKINVYKTNGVSIPDPTAVIGGFVSYKFYFGTVVLEGPAGIGGSYRFKTADAVATIV